MTWLLKYSSNGAVLGGGRSFKFEKVSICLAHAYCSAAVFPIPHCACKVCENAAMAWYNTGGGLK